MTLSASKTPNEPDPSASSTPPQTNATASNDNSQSSFLPSINTSTTATSTPIITYPEFLTRNYHQDALPRSLTTTRAIYRVIIYILNISGVLSAVALALAHYYVNPMRNALTDARRDFAQHVLKLLGDFNQRMGDMVAARGIKGVKGSKRRVERGDNSDSSARKELYNDAQSESEGGQSPSVNDRMTTEDKNSDGSDKDIAATEFYQRDIGTQTSPAILSRQTSSQSGHSLTKSQFGVRFQSPRPPTTKPSSEDRIAHDEQQISGLQDSVSALVAGGSSYNNHVEEAARQVSDLKSYLGRLTQAANFPIIGDERTRVFHTTANAVRSGTGGGEVSAGGSIDAAQELKGEIRRLKGYLLSAKNFPVPKSQRGARAGSGR